MPKAIIALLLIAATPPLAPAQSTSQSAIDKLPTVTTQGDTNPEVVSDVNTQLIWLMAASSASNESALETAARREYLRAAFGSLNAQNQAKLNETLRDFRTRHDAFAANYNTLIPSVSREDVWVEYRNFRVKVNDLVAETVRTLNDVFPESAIQFRSAIQDCKRMMNLSTYRSSADPDYASSSRAAATGFTYIQGAVTNASNPASGAHSAPSPTYVTAVIVGMVPGCHGKVSPQIRIGDAADPWIDAPQSRPLEYVNFQSTRFLEHGGGFTTVVSCAIAKSMPSAK